MKIFHPLKNVIGNSLFSFWIDKKLKILNLSHKNPFLGHQDFYFCSHKDSIEKQFFKMQNLKEKKILIALDFDHTVINANSDTYVYKLAPGKTIPPELKILYKRDGWTHYMGEVFKFLHAHGVRKEKILQTIEEISLTDGMEELFSLLPKDKTEYIIISDANSIFIDHLMECKGIKEAVSKVFTNPAHFDEDECLRVEMFHHQDWCRLSTKNLCKGQILSDFVTSKELEGTQYSVIAFVGDGEHDFCPCLRLQNTDLVFPRSKFNLEKTIARHSSENNLELKAAVHLWNSGKEIYETILPFYKKIEEMNLPNPRLQDGKISSLVE